MTPKFVKHCPVCSVYDAELSIETLHTTEECNNCGAEWDSFEQLIYDPREELSEGDILQKGWFVDIIN